MACASRCGLLYFHAASRPESAPNTDPHLLPACAHTLAKVRLAIVCEGERRVSVAGVRQCCGGELSPFPHVTMEWLFGRKKTPDEMLRENQRLVGLSAPTLTTAALCQRAHGTQRSTA